MKKKESENEKQKAYTEYVESHIPKTKWMPSLLNAFWVGGLICVLGQIINDVFLILVPSMAEQTAWVWTLVVLIFLASLLTGIGIYDRIGKFAGAGSVIPITGFSNSIASPAIEAKSEGIIYGICVKMFTIAGPVIVLGLVGSLITGIIYLFI
jgi:stage V sporulation protein AC